MPGHVFEGNPVSEGITRSGSDTPVHHPENPAGSTYSSTRGLRLPEQLERQPEFHSSDKTRHDSPVPTLQGPCSRSPKPRGSLRFLPPLEMRPSSIAPNPADPSPIHGPPLLLPLPLIAQGPLEFSGGKDPAEFAVRVTGRRTRARVAASGGRHGGGNDAHKALGQDVFCGRELFCSRIRLPDSPDS